MEASPGRITIFFPKAQIYLSRGDVEGAIEVLKEAVSMNETYADTVCQLSRTYLSLSRSYNSLLAISPPP